MGSANAWIAGSCQSDFARNYGTTAPYPHYGVVGKEDRLVHDVPVDLPGPRLPHDVAFTEHYAVLNDMPLFLGAGARQTRLHRWRMNMVTGASSEQDLSDSCTGFGTINSEFGGRACRYTYAATNEPGWFLFNGLVKHDT
jgi:carotenoid cleavage dioxygenase-like enzyme